MSLLWKKPKSGRLSRFLSEFQHSPKHGGIMVVETGFPASLIDLFFKNRDRLKKSSCKTKRIQRLIQTAPNASLPITPDVSLEKPVARKTVRTTIKKASFVGGGVTGENNKHQSDKNGCVCVCSGRSGALVLIAFKILVVAMLALSTTKNLTMGITLFALAVLLVENVAASVLTRFKLCNTHTKTQKPLPSIHDENLVSCGRNQASDDSRDENSKPCTKETETIAVREDLSSKDVKIRDLLSKDEKSKSKSSSLQSKILKKLRSYKKKKKSKKIVIEDETLIDVSSLVPEDKSEVIEAESEEEKSNPPLIEPKGDNMSGTVMIVIVLTGLLSGKILLAIGLTLSCLYLRFGAAKKFGLCI